MFKKLVTFLFIGAFAFGLAACQQRDQTPPKNDQGLNYKANQQDQTGTQTSKPMSVQPQPADQTQQ